MESDYCNKCNFIKDPQCVHCERCKGCNYKTAFHKCTKCNIKFCPYATGNKCKRCKKSYCENCTKFFYGDYKEETYDYLCGECYKENKEYVDYMGGSTYFTMWECKCCTKNICQCNTKYLNNFQNNVKVHKKQMDNEEMDNKEMDNKEIYDKDFPPL